MNCNAASPACSACCALELAGQVLAFPAYLGQDGSVTWALASLAGEMLRAKNAYPPEAWLMTADLPRRGLFRLAGVSAAGAAGLTIAGCANKAMSQPASVADAASYVSRPDLTPPVVTVKHYTTGADHRYFFLDAPYSGPGQGGALILDASGEVVWFGPSTPARHRLELNTQTYRGQQVLTWWEGLVVQGYGKGVAVIADSSYRVRHVVRAANGLMADLHEFVITPAGTALITAYRTHPNVDLSPVGGPSSGYLVSGVAQEIDIISGRLLFEWDSIDHVDLWETYQKFGVPGDGGRGTAARPFNYFHINSIAVDSDGDLLISSRNTWTVYKVRRGQAGTVIWRMNGKKSDFTMGPLARFFWQHDVRPHGEGVLTLFDNGASPAREKQSRALVLTVDAGAMHVTLKKAYAHPGKRMLAGAMGNAQLLPDGRMVVGWGTEPFFSEFAADGRLLLDGSITKGAPSYRAYSDHWAGHPVERPAVAARHGADGATVYASWNGATDVASWTFYAGKTRSALTNVGSARRSGFETAVAVPSSGPYFAAQAHDAAGHPLARSATVQIA